METRKNLLPGSDPVLFPRRMVVSDLRNPFRIVLQRGIADIPVV